MAIHLVEEPYSQDRTKSSKLARLMPGIYVDVGDDVDATVLKHAVRIAKFLYPDAYLSGASAFLLGPTPDGKLFLSGRQKQRSRVWFLEIIQDEAPKRPSIEETVVDDGQGAFRVAISSTRQRFLESLRLRSEPVAAIDDKMRTALAACLVEEHGSPRAAAAAVRSLAWENEWYREGWEAERLLLQWPKAVYTRQSATAYWILALLSLGR